MYYVGSSVENQLQDQFIISGYPNEPRVLSDHKVSPTETYC